MLASRPFYMEEFLQYVIGKLAQHPEDAIITKTEKAGSVTFHICLRKSDVGRVIGRGGQTVQAMRSLLQAAGQKKGIRVYLDITSQ
ncbi:MAG: KH domain-containing protein [Chthoniobacterales bacterium]|nr:KH domain-containing protein [Chthoniobacterales bacterium]